MDSLSRANLWLRHIAVKVSPDNPVRIAAARAWQRVLNTRQRVAVMVNGREIWLHPEYRSLSASYEVEALNRCLSLCNPESIVWDVGANIGMYSIMIALHQRAKRILALELHPGTAERLTSHIAANRVSHVVTPMQIAVTDGSSDSLEISINNGTLADPTARFTALGAAPGPKVRVRAASLDQLVVERGEAPTFVKMDIEGAEYHALKGAQKLLRGEFGVRPIVLLSAHPMFIEEYGVSMADVSAIVRDVEYVSLTLKGERKLPEVFEEFLLVPSELEQDVLNTLKLELS